MKLVKFLLSIVLIYVVLNQYNIVSITKGFIQSGEKSTEQEILTELEEIKYIEISDNYYIMYETENNLYFEEAHDVTELNLALAIAEAGGVDVKKVDYTWLVIGVVGLIAIGCIPSKKKKNN